MANGIVVMCNDANGAVPALQYDRAPPLRWGYNDLNGDGVADTGSAFVARGMAARPMRNRWGLR